MVKIGQDFNYTFRKLYLLQLFEFLHSSSRLSFEHALPRGYPLNMPFIKELSQAYSLMVNPKIGCNWLAYVKVTMIQL